MARIGEGQGLHGLLYATGSINISPFTTHPETIEH